MSKLLDQILAIATPIIEQNNCELVDAEFKKEGSDKILRFYVDLQQGHISLDECAEINRQLSDRLDETDLIEEQYILEVSSPGVNRRLKTETDFAKFKGSKVDVSLYEAVNGKKKFIAELGSVQNGTVVFLVGEEGVSVPMEKIGKVNLHFEF